MPPAGEPTPLQGIRQRPATEVRAANTMLMPFLRGRKGRRIGHRGAAGEALALVHRGLAVDEALSGEQRHLVVRTDCDHCLRLPGPERRAGDLRVDAADDRELAGRAEVEL